MMTLDPLWTAPAAPESQAPSAAELTLALAALAWLRGRVVVEWDEHAPLAGLVRVTGCAALPTELSRDPMVAPDDAIRALIGAPAAAAGPQGVTISQTLQFHGAGAVSAEQLAAAMRASVPPHLQGVR